MPPGWMKHPAGRLALLQSYGGGRAAGGAVLGVSPMEY